MAVLASTPNPAKMNFKALRKRLGLTQERAAALVGVAHVTWWRWEHGRMKPLPVFAGLIGRLPELVRSNGHKNGAGKHRNRKGAR